MSQSTAIGSGATSKYDWSRLNRLQVGRFAEYFVKMEFTLHGFDVYTTEVDDKGIDFIVRRSASRYFDIQVKSVRESGYVYLTKEAVTLRPNLLIALVVLRQGSPPSPFLFPSTVWLNPDGVFVSRDYVGRKSDPEWGINVSKKNLPALDRFAFDSAAKELEK